MNTSLADFIFDATDLPCPQPLLRTKLKISKLTNGSSLLVITKDPSFTIDFAVFAKKNGHMLLKSWEEDLKFFNLIQKNPSDKVDRSD